jgi:hypothetical protein
MVRITPVSVIAKKRRYWTGASARFLARINIAKERKFPPIPRRSTHGMIYPSMNNVILWKTKSDS